MIVAALLLATSATVDYETVAKPLPLVLAELTARSGVEMRASKGIESDKLVIRVRDADITKLREKIAEAVAGKWSENDGIFTLQRDETSWEKRRMAVLEERVQQIRKSIDRFPRIGNSVETMAKYHSSGHTYRAAHAIVKKMDLSAMSAVPLGYRKVYSTNPTAAQTRITGVYDILREAVTEHNRIADIALHLDVDEPAVGTPQYRARQSLTRIWKEPVLFQLVCRPHDFGMTAMARFISGGEVLDVVPLSFDWPPNDPLALPEDAKPDSTIEFSRNATGMARLMSINLWDGSTDTVEVEPQVIEALKQPTAIDPLSLHYSEMLLQIGGHTRWQIVASVRDEMVPMLPHDKPTLRSALDAVIQLPYVWNSLGGGWLTLAPTGIGNLMQIDRKALESFVRDCEKQMPSLDAWGKLAEETPASFTVPLMYPYLKAFTSNFGGGEQEWLYYRFFNALTQRQKLTAREGGTLKIAEIGSPAREILTILTFQMDVPRISDGSGVVSISELETGPNNEPTDLFPRGLPPDLVVRFTTRTSFALLPTPKAPNDLSPYPFPVSVLAYNATVDPKVFLNGIRPVYPTFRIGMMNRIVFEVPVGGNLRLQGYLYEYDIDRSSKVYELSTAPKAFKEAYEKALKERGG